MCVIPFQCVLKKNAKLRMVLYCRHLNSFVPVPKFRQESIGAVTNQIEEYDLMIVFWL